MLLAKFVCPTSLYTPHFTGFTHMYMGNFGFQSSSIESFRGLSQTLQSYSGLMPQIASFHIPSNSLIILPFDDGFPELWSCSLNRP